MPAASCPTCSAPLEAPLAAEGEPVIIGFQNPEGDPNGSFPEASLAAQAAVDYINAELGGWGSDIQNGVPGRPIQLEVCRTAISPDDSQRCANELVAKDPDIVVSTINFFGNHLPIFEAAGIPAIVTSPVTIADYTSPVGVRHRRRRRLPRGAHRTGRVRHQRPRGDASRRPVGRHAPGRRLLLRPRGQAARRHQGRGRRAPPSGPARSPISSTSACRSSRPRRT